LKLQFSWSVGTAEKFIFHSKHLLLESKKQKLKPESPKIEVCKYKSWSAGTNVAEKKSCPKRSSCKICPTMNTSKNPMQGVLEVILCTQSSEKSNNLENVRKGRGEIPKTCRRPEVSPSN
jgi:hypothetical protein